MVYESKNQILIRSEGIASDGWQSLAYHIILLCHEADGFSA
jgi:hypothetical protein